MTIEHDFETVREALGPLEEFAWNALSRIEAEAKRLRAELNEALAQVEYDQETGKDLVAEVKRLQAALEEIARGPSKAAGLMARQALEEPT